MACRRLMTAGARLRGRGVIHSRRLPGNLAVTPLTVGDRRPGVGGLVAGGAGPVRPGIAAKILSGMATGALKAGVLALEPAGVVGRGRAPAGRRMASPATGIVAPVAFLMAISTGPALLQVIIVSVTTGALDFGVFPAEKVARAGVLIFHFGAAAMAPHTIRPRAPNVPFEIRPGRPGRPGDALTPGPRPTRFLQALMTADTTAAFSPAEAIEPGAVTTATRLFFMAGHGETHQIVIDRPRIDGHGRLTQAPMHKMAVDAGADHPGVAAVTRQSRFGDGLMALLAVDVGHAEKGIVAGAAFAHLRGVPPAQLPGGKVVLAGPGQGKEKRGGYSQGSGSGRHDDPPPVPRDHGRAFP